MIEMSKSKEAEREAVKAVLAMAIPSTDPHSFEELTKALGVMCNSRNLNLSMCLDCTSFIDKDTAPSHDCDTTIKPVLK